MNSGLKCPRVLGQNSLIFIIIIGIFFGILLFWSVQTPKAETDFIQISALEKLEGLVMIEKNSLLPITEPINPESQLKIIQKIKVIITAYSSTPSQTDEDPYITAAGTWVRDGIIANNLLPFGTKIRISELFGEKIFVVEDRMSQKKSNYHIDIWFSDYWQALNFGSKESYIEILEK